MSQLWTPPPLSCAANSTAPVCGALAPLYLALLVRLYGGARDPPARLCKVETNTVDPEPLTEEYDFIVVGAGSAGCVVANRLTENEHWKVLLLEAGPEQPDVTLVPALSRVLPKSNIDWAYKTQPDGKSCLTSNGCSWPRGKTMGGTSSINAMMYVRGNKLDFDSWAALGNDGWSYDQVLPYFKKSEQNLNEEGLNRTYHGVLGPMRIERFAYTDKPTDMLIRAFEQKGLPNIDINGEHQEGVMSTQSHVFNGQRFSANNGFIQPIRYKRKNLTVKTNSEALEVLIDEQKRAYGIKYERDGAIHTAVAKKEVILSGGVINSPKLLMLSGIGPKEHLDELNITVVQDLKVGYNLHDQVNFNGIVLALSNETATKVDDNEIIERIKDYKKQGLIKQGPLAANGLTSVMVFLKSDPKLEAPDLQIQPQDVYWEDYVKDPISYNADNFLPTSFYNGVIIKAKNNVPKSRGRLYLNSTNPHGHPIIFANYLAVSEDLDLIVKGTKYVLSLEETQSFRSHGARFVRTQLPACKHLEWGTDEYIECLARQYTTPAHHPVGTCKMGPKADETAVVDPRLRVYGVTGVRVIDASIMPVVTRGNTHAPAVMIGEKGADMIKEDWLECARELGDEDFLLS